MIKDNLKNKQQCAIHDVSSSASNGFRPNVYISDDLEDLRRRYTPEQLKKMWKDAYPKLSEISSNVIMEHLNSDNEVAVCECEEPDIFESEQMGYGICLNCSKKVKQTVY